MRTVKDIMIKNFNVVTLGDSIACAYQKMKASNIDTTIVLDKKAQCVGLITIWDLLKAKALSYPFDTTPVEEIMSFPVVTITEDSSIEESISLMMNNRIKNVVVVDSDQRVVGLISAKAIVECEECIVNNKISCTIGRPYKIAIIGGTGKQGRGLALRWGKGGHHILIGSRSLENAKKIAEQLRGNLNSIGVEPKIEAGLNSEVVKDAEIIVLTIPYQSIEELILSIKDGLHEGQIIISPVVPLKMSDGGEMGIERHRISAAEKVYLMTKPLGPETVAAFHTIPAANLSRIEFPLNFDVVVAGNDAKSKKVVMKLISQIPNLRPLDGGSLKNAETLEYLTSLAINIGRKYKKPTIGLKFI
ncbi:MAG: NADPH-dependent F420 reductase [Candidatus Odinarchaeum yellowstonii]|uniref:NADPH-dependent F420 reductase n=1 Tax=Odinarchaeota yellowstonii (strain LCB_4) TaxID=1841599 RepID=A0AAF0D1A7_ODILC|nr:MAG: NADPH-dependent F420 reductase [Candidatus Odinarchaeum yellowstonii]